jgi:hypothetical protein
MGLKERLQRKITMKVYELHCMVILTVLTTLLLINIWPRFSTKSHSREGTQREDMGEEKPACKSLFC